VDGVNCLVVVPKKDGRLHLCLDQQDLNKAIQREPYPLPMAEDNAKLFTILDVRHIFWPHIALDEESSLLTTFHSPFRRFRWKIISFGIKSAPEVFQHKMHEFSEGLQSIAIVADDFVLVGLVTLWKKPGKAMTGIWKQC